MKKLEREAARQKARSHAATALTRSNVTLKRVAEILFINARADVYHRFNDERHESGALSYADMLMLASAPDTAELVRLLLAPLLELVDPQSLRLRDLDAMSRNAEAATLTRIVLRDVVRRLGPETFADTASVIDTGVKK